MSKQYKLYIFDLDGTLVETRSRETFRKTADDWMWLPARLNVLRALVDRGADIAIATNQGGVAFGYMSELDMQEELRKTREDIGRDNVFVCVCYNHEKASLSQYRHADIRRKPQPGMLLEAMEAFEASPADTVMIGDRDEDKAAAEAAGVTFVWAADFFAIGYIDGDPIPPANTEENPPCISG